MEEGTLTADGVVHEMARPFMVVATQNPIDMEGTYVLPEAQLDRFLMKLTVGYPSAEAEAEILRTQKMGSTVTAPDARCSPPQDVAHMIDVVKQVEVAPALEQYIVAHRRRHPVDVRAAARRLAPRQPGPAARRPGLRGRGRAARSSRPRTSRTWRRSCSRTG